MPRLGWRLSLPLQAVVAALLGHGVQTFPDLLRTSGLPAGQLKNALLVLIQQNCVNTYFQQEPPTLRGPGPSYQLYEAALDRILQIIRHGCRGSGVGWMPGQMRRKECGVALLAQVAAAVALW
jgi:hypothetical protein